MKKILALVLAMVMVFAVVGCTPNASPDASPDASPAADGDAYKVAVVLGVGGLGDSSFNDSIYDGCKLAMAQDASITVQVIEPTEVAEFEGHYMDLAKGGEYDLIVGSGFDGVEAVGKVADLFPEQKFLFVDGDVGARDNVTSVVFRDEEKAFLLGYMASQVSTTGKVGFVGGMDIPSINMFAAGFEAGVAYGDKSATVERKYVGAWNDTSTGKELALALYDGGCDIVYAAAGGSGLGVFTAAAEKEMMVIGADTNQCLIDPAHVLVSGIRTLNLVIRDGIVSAKAGTLVGGTQSAGLKENGVDYIREGSTIEVSDEIITKVDQAKADIIAGTITVPSTIEDVATYIAGL